MVCSSVQLCRPSTSRSTGQSKYAAGVGELHSLGGASDDDVFVAIEVFVVDDVLTRFCNQFVM